MCIQSYRPDLFTVYLMSSCWDGRHKGSTIPWTAEGNRRQPGHFFWLLFFGGVFIFGAWEVRICLSVRLNLCSERANTDQKSRPALPGLVYNVCNRKHKCTHAHVETRVCDVILKSGCGTSHFLTIKLQLQNYAQHNLHI